MRRVFDAFGCISGIVRRSGRAEVVRCKRTSYRRYVAAICANRERQLPILEVGLGRRLKARMQQSLRVSVTPCRK
jgi:hypothetical protein